MPKKKKHPTQQHHPSNPPSASNNTAGTQLSPKSPEQRRQIREERKKRNMELAAKPFARVMEVSTPYSDIIFQIHKQMDMAWKFLKQRSGEPTGLTYEELMDISLKLQQHVIEFHNLTKMMAKKARWNYKTPPQMQDILDRVKVLTNQQAQDSSATPPAVEAVPPAKEKTQALPTTKKPAAATSKKAKPATTKATPEAATEETSQEAPEMVQAAVNE